MIHLVRHPIHGGQHPGDRRDDEDDEPQRSRRIITEFRINGELRISLQPFPATLTTNLAFTMTTVLCYSATLGADVTLYGTPCRVDMGNVGILDTPLRFVLYR